jgi:Tol biopolymer transport system component
VPARALVGEVRAIKLLSKWGLVVVFGCLVVLAFSTAAGGSSTSTDQIVFVTNQYCGPNGFTDCGRGEIAVVNPDGSGLQVLTHEPASAAFSVFSPRWSPDRQEIAYVRPKAGQRYYGAARIWLMAANGTHQRPLTRSRRSDLNTWGPVLDWAPNGRQIVFTDNSNLYLANVQTGAVKSLLRTRHWVGSPVWSPNGRWIAFLFYRKGDPATQGSQGQIYLLSTATHHLQQVTHFPRGSWPRDPAWSPDSSRIAFRYATTPAAYGVNLQIGIGVINPDGTHFQSLNAPGFDPSWSPDGSSIVFCASNGRHTGHPYDAPVNLEVMNADGSGRHLITHVTGHQWKDTEPDW